MAIREVIRMGHPLLRQIATPLSTEEIQSSEVQSLIKDMIDTMREEGGIGIAAPQIAIPKQLTIIEIPTDSERYPDAPSSELMVIINPEIKVLDKTLQGFWEGCLSVPQLRGYVERPRKVQVDYLDEFANPQTIIAEGFLATVFQHELDHLFGVLYVDHLKDSKKFSFLEEFDQFWADE